MKDQCVGRLAALGLVALLCVVGATFPAGAEVVPYGLKIEKVMDTTAELGDIVQSPTGELWLLERSSGTIRVFDAGTEVASLTLPVTTACGSGLLDVAFAPDYPRSRRSFVYYVDDTGKVRVDRVNRNSGVLSQGGLVLDLGTNPTGCQPGGGIEVGPDGLLYVAVGDLGVGADAQDDLSYSGKVLRAELDGSVPAGNVSGSLVWAKGFRDGRDLAIGSGGQVYMADLGASGSVSDEINEVVEGGNYGWSIAHGAVPPYALPLVTYPPASTVGPEGLAVVKGSGLGGGLQGSLIYPCTELDEMQQASPTGTDADFYDPEGDRDGTPDPGCPDGFNAVAEGADGWLYAANTGTGAGVWRVWQDLPGPREVSAPGSPFPLTVEPDGSDLKIGWEYLGTLDVGRPKRPGNQPITVYTVWEGTLPIVGGVYDHGIVAQTDGVVESLARRSATITPGSGDRYYLVTAQGDNLESSHGSASDGTPRAEPADYCLDRGYGIDVADCAEKWVDPRDGVTELSLIDYNPYSPTYLQALTMSDFRGRVVKMDLSANNCGFCGDMADEHHLADEKYRDRDVVILTVFTQSYAGVPAIPPGNCASLISAWASNHGEESPIVCDVDLNSDGHGDVSWQYWDPVCGGTPQNIYVDQGHVIYAKICGYQLFLQWVGGVNPPVNDMLKSDSNQETCE